MESTFAAVLNPASNQKQEFLIDYAWLVCDVERQFYADWIKRGEDPDELIKEYQVRFGLSWHQVNSIYRMLRGKVDSVKEQQKQRIPDLEGRIESAKKAIAKWERRIKDNKSRAARKKNPVPIFQGAQQKLRFKIHNKKRRLAILQNKLEKAKKAQPVLIFGSKRLWKAQFNLEANGYASHQDWRKDWLEKRHSQFVCVGKATDLCGNRSAQLDLLKNLKIRVPYCLEEKYGQWVEFRGIHYPYGQEHIDAAIDKEKTLTHRFIMQSDYSWRIHTTVEVSEVEPTTEFLKGMMGTDLNPDSIGWAICNRDGNLIKKGEIKFDLTGKTSEQSEQIISLAVKELVQIASGEGVGITKEILDFTAKKRTLKERSNRYARMLSGFIYAKFDQLLDSRCAKEGVALFRHKAAYSSIIGMAKYMRRYGLNSATAAAFTMARRGLRLSERLPSAYATLLQVDSNVPVWRAWARFKKELLPRGTRRHSYFDLDTTITEHVVKKLDAALGKAKRYLKELKGLGAFPLPLLRCVSGQLGFGLLLQGDLMSECVES